jgi:hypothetical protein
MYDNKNNLRRLVDRNVPGGEDIEGKSIGVPRIICVLAVALSDICFYQQTIVISGPIK